MGIYIVNLISMPFYGLLKDKRFATALPGIQMFLILAFRSITTGMDLTNYRGGFEYIATLNFRDMIGRLHFFRTADLVYPYVYESGYSVINWIAAKIGLSFHGFLVLIAAFTMISISVFIYRYSVRPYISYIIFIGLGMYMYSFGILRQTIALCVVLWAFPFIYEKKYIKTVVTILIAFTIHRSSLIFCLLLLFRNIKISKKYLVRFLIGCILFMFISPILYKILFVKILSFLVKTRYISSTFSFNYQIIVMFLISITILIFLDFNLLENYFNRMMMWGFLLSIPLEILGMNNEGFARIVEYFYLFSIIVIPLTIENYGLKINLHKKYKYQVVQKRGEVLLVTKVLLLFAMLWLMIHQLKGTVLVPYKLF